MKLIDLHVHSNCSDGTFSPSQLVTYAKEKGLSAIALTDHDTITGVAEAQKKGQEIGLTVIPGIEFSAYYAGREVHILGYYIDPTHENLNAKLTQLVESRKTRNLKMLEALAHLNMPITLSDLEEGSTAETVFTRAHFAAALLKKGYINSREEAFQKYISPGKPAYVPREHFTVKECISLIHEAGGLAVLAHPMLYGYSPSEVTQIIKDMKKQGLDGIETFYSTHTPNDTMHLKQLCKNNHLFPTGGSDFHGANKPNLDLGIGYGKLKIPFALLEDMQHALK